jgi:hypothetical protein
LPAGANILFFSEAIVVAIKNTPTDGRPIAKPLQVLSFQLDAFIELRQLEARSIERSVAAIWGYQISRI